MAGSGDGETKKVMAGSDGVIKKVEARSEGM